MFTDATDVAIGGVLYQRTSVGEHKVRAFVNRILKVAERNYFTSEKGILAMVYALNKFRYYLCDQRLKSIRTTKLFHFR